MSNRNDAATLRAMSTSGKLGPRRDQAKASERLAVLAATGRCAFPAGAAAMIARVVIACLAACAMQSLSAQAPSWNNSGSLPSKPPANAVNRTAGNTTATVAAVGAPPRDRDCKATITKPDAPYYDEHERPTRFNTDGTEDHGQILNGIAAVTRSLQNDLNDVQVRVEQLRCEEQNIKAKLDYIIRRLP